MLEKFKKIKIVFMDIDGVLNDGVVRLLGTESLRSWYVRDRIVIKILSSIEKLDIKIVWITGRQAEGLIATAKELGVSEVYGDIKNKLKIMKSVLEKYSIEKENSLYIGDDIIDLACIEYAGIGCAPSDAVAEVLNIADFVSKNPGGRGAVREIIENIFKAHGIWEEIIESFKKNI